MPSTETAESSKKDCTITTVGGTERVPETSVISQSRLSASDLDALAEIRAELDCLDSGATEMADGTSQESEDLAGTSEAVLEGNPSTDTDEVPGRIPAVVRRGPTLTASRDIHSSTPSVVVIQRPGRVTSSTSGSYVTSSVRSVMATPSQTTTKRAATGNCGPVIAKVIITGNPNSGQSRPIVSMGSRSENVSSTQHVKIVGSGQSGVTTLLASPTKAITLAQAQQMGLLSPAKVQQILPRATVKQTHDTGTVLTTTASTGQMIRIPATQNVVTTTSSNVHQIQVPGRQLQYVRLVNASEGTARVTTSSTPITQSTTPTIRAQPSLRVVPIAPATEENRGARRVTNTNQRPQQRSGSNQETARPRSSSTPRPGQPQPRPSLEPNGIRPKKPCNCTKSQCLKLYCDCFANGEFCHLCNCANCSNNLEHEEERQRAIKSCLERNPNAFRPKIGKGHVGDERRHNKGCNCKRSGCLKNYCECYEAKIPCSGMCKCVGCRNVEESPSEKKTLRDLADAAEVRVRQQAAVKSRLSAQVREVMHPGPILGRKPRALLTSAVIEATCQCMLAQAKGVQSRYGNVPLSKIQESVIKEFGKCLIRIVESAEGSESR